MSDFKISAGFLHSKILPIHGCNNVVGEFSFDFRANRLLKVFFALEQKNKRSNEKILTSSKF